MRYVTIFLVTLVASCSWSWPFGSKDTGNCLDDDSCEGANPFEEQLVGGTWHCYGVSRNEPWDCSQERDDSKIRSVTNTAPPRPLTVPTLSLEDSTPAEQGSEQRAEMPLVETIASDETPIPAEEAAAPSSTRAISLADYSNTSFAVQLIALQTIDEIREYAAKVDLDPPVYVKIRSQDADWYVLLLGIFEDKTTADAAADNWSESHNRFSRPWVRPIRPLREAARLAAP